MVHACGNTTTRTFEFRLVISHNLMTVREATEAIEAERARIAAELRSAQEAMERRRARPIVPLERDPLTGIYRPKQLH